MFNQYPYLNLNDLNLDYILKVIKEMRYEVTNFVSINAIKYADPIQWNITSQYEKNTIVIDPVTGTAYISVAPVPSGVALNRPEYWTVVFDLGSFVTRAAQNFTSHWESETTTTATFPTTTGGWLVWGDVLYKALTNITAGDTYVVNGNIEHFTIEDLYNAYLNTIANILAIIGELGDLTTTDTSSIVDAINSIITERGALADLTTSDIDSIVDAINSIITERGALSNLTASDITSIVNAINSININKCRRYDSVANAIADTSLQENMLVITDNFYDDELGGGAHYLVTSGLTVDGYTIFNCNNGLQLKLISDWSLRRLGAKNNMDITDLWRFYMTNAPHDEDIIIETGEYNSRYMMIYGHDRIIDFNGSIIHQIEDPNEYHSGISLNLTTGAELRENIYVRNLNLDVSTMVYQSPIFSRPFNINTQATGKVRNIHYQNIHITGGQSATDFWHCWFINADNGKANISGIYIEDCTVDYAYNGIVYLPVCTDVHIYNCDFPAYKSNVVNQTMGGSDCDTIEINNCKFSNVLMDGSGSVIHTGNAHVIINDSIFNGDSIAVQMSNGGIIDINNSIIKANQAVRIDGVAGIANINNSKLDGTTMLYDNIGAIFKLSNVDMANSAFNILPTTRIIGNIADYRGQFQLPATMSGNVTPTSPFRVSLTGDVVNIPYPSLIVGTLTNTNSESVTLSMYNDDTNTIMQNIVSDSPNTPIFALNRATNHIRFSMSGSYSSGTTSLIYVIPL